LSLPAAPGDDLPVLPRHGILYQKRLVDERYISQPIIGFYSGFSCFLIKFNCSEHVAVIGYGKGRHMIFSGLIQQVGKSYGAVQEAVLGMDM